MATIIHKKSSVPGKVPLVGDLTPGELAINTNDGIVYTKKDDNTIVEIGAGAGEQEFVATGNITAGEVVGLRSDGTVESITTSIIPETLSGTTIFDTGNVYNPSGAYDNINEKYLVMYSESTFDGDNGQFAYGYFNDVTGEFLKTNGGNWLPGLDPTDIKTIYCSVSDRFVTAYFAPGGGYIMIGRSNGSTITFGAPVLFLASGGRSLTLSYDSDENRVLITFCELAGSYVIKGMVGSFSVNSMTFGSSILLGEYNAADFYITASYSPVQKKHLIVFSDSINNKGYTAIAEIAGTTVSFNTPQEFSSLAIYKPELSYDSVLDHFVTSYGISSTGYCAIFEIVGSVVNTINSGIQFSTGISWRHPIVFDPQNNCFVIAHYSGSYSRTIVGERIGNSITFDAFSNNEAGGYNHTTVYDSINNRTWITFQDNGDGKTIIHKNEEVVSNVNSAIGISSEIISDTSTGVITIRFGTNNQQSGLTTGTKYYVDYEGNITSTPNQTYDFEYLGRALSATEILIEGIE